jgi:fucose 4-O-acetylase-like acetyltransferase
MKKKIEWIDIAKGFGILTVVAGHIYEGDIRRIIFIFHMPLFFFISGYLFKPDLNRMHYFKKKSYHLLVPYIAFLLPIYFFIPENIYDMKYSSYGIPVVTLISSIVLTLNVKQLSVLLSRVKVLKKVFSKLGEASLVIMFLHQPFQLLIKSYVTEDETVRFIIASLVSFAFYYIFTKNIYLRAVFLGSKTDFEKIKQNKK